MSQAGGKARSVLSFNVLNTLKCRKNNSFKGSEIKVHRADVE